MSGRVKTNAAYYWLLGVTMLTLLLGVVMIFSSSSAMAYAAEGDSYYYLKRQLIWIVLGAGALWAISTRDYERLRKWTWPMVGLTLLGLVAVYIPGIGHSAGGASRWIAIGSLKVQPSELAKLAIVMAAAEILTLKKSKIGKFEELAVPLLPIVAVFGLLIVLQPDLGTAFVISLSTLIVAFAAGARGRHLAGIAGCLGIAVILFIVSEPFRLKRFLAFLDPWADPRGAGFHIIQSLLAFGSGKWHGIGLGLSRQKFFYLPAAHTDFIFAIIGEELGLIGTLLLVALFAAFAYTGMKIAFRARDFHSRLLAAGLTSMIVLQAVINMAAVTGMLPITGIPLPLVSFGGSSLVATMASIGIILNVSCRERVRQGVSSDGRGSNSSNEGGRPKGNSVRRRDGGPRLSGAGARRAATAKKPRPVSVVRRHPARSGSGRRTARGA